MLEGLQQSHGWWPILCSMGFYKIYRSSVLLLQPYWNALLTQRILDIFCCVKWRKSFWYPFQWARWVSTVPWVMPYQPSMSCHNKSRPEMTYWTAGNVVATKFYVHAEESYPWVMSWKNPLSEDRPSPMGLLESLQPVGMGTCSKTIFFNSMTK